MAKRILIEGSLVRGAYGLISLLLPKLLFGLVRESEADLGVKARYFNRLFGGRDLLVASGTLAAVRSGALSGAVKANLACELTDTISLVEEVRVRGGRRGLRTGMDRILALGLAFNIAGYVAWVRALRAL